MSIIKDWTTSILKVYADLWPIIGKELDFHSCTAFKSTCKKLRLIFYKYIISEACIGDVSVRKYVTTKKRYVDKIRVLKVCVTSDEDMFFIRRIKNLKVLDLSSSTISDKGIGYLREMDIISLSLKGCNKCSLDIVATLASFSSLQHIDLRFNPNRNVPILEGEHPMRRVNSGISDVLGALSRDTHAITSLTPYLGNPLVTILSGVVASESRSQRRVEYGFVENFTVRTINVSNCYIKDLVKDVFINAFVISDNKF